MKNLWKFGLAAFCCFAVTQNVNAEPRAAEVWLKKNREDKDVVVVKGGLQYKVLRAAQGCHPDPREPVTLHYEVTLAADGRVVDSTYQRGGPSTVSIRRMIRAWKEGIPMMREGEMWQFFVPPSLGYGPKGMQPHIQHDSVLVFRVELLKVGRCK